MNRRVDRCLRLGVLALPGIAGAVSFALGLPVAQWFVVVATAGGVLCLAVLYGVCRAAVSRRIRAARARGRPWLLAILAAGLPEPYGLTWAEDMHAQLYHAGHGHRGRVLWNVVTRVPVAWLGHWWTLWREYWRYELRAALRAFVDGARYPDDRS